MVRLTIALTLLLATPSMAQQTGVTTGPAAGSPTTLGAGGQTGATPHQADTLGKGAGSAMKDEQAGQKGGSAEKVPGVNGAESGTNPGPGQRPVSK